MVLKDSRQKQKQMGASKTVTEKKYITELKVNCSSALSLLSRMAELINAVIMGNADVIDI